MTADESNGDDLGKEAFLVWQNYVQDEHGGLYANSFSWKTLGHAAAKFTAMATRVEAIVSERSKQEIDRLLASNQDLETKLRHESGIASQAVDEIVRLKKDLADSFTTGGTCRVLSDPTGCVCPKCRAERAEDELAKFRKDIEDTAKSFTIPMPMPGTDMARMMIKNRLLVQENERLRSCERFLKEGRHVLEDVTDGKNILDFMNCWLDDARRENDKLRAEIVALAGTNAEVAQLRRLIDRMNALLAEDDALVQDHEPT